ncbi:MAG TPA: PEGA domain-containing protein [Xanthobacteraceae bacterium]|nr:PEGA domain-containing protein [Xanthobacteraceae bacterium]
MSRIFFVAACGLTLGACSGMPSFELPSFNSAPSTVSLRIESEPPGADAKTSSGATCRTPCALDVPAAGDFSVDLALNGYLPQTVAVHALPPDDPRENASAQARLDPNPVYVELEPAPPPAKKKPAAKKPKTAAKKPTSSQVTAPVTTARAGTPATAAGLTSAPEPAPMSATAPWPTPQ